METVATTAKRQGNCLVRGADGALYAVSSETCECTEQNSGTVRTSVQVSNETRTLASTGDHASARALIDPGDHASARALIDPGDHAWA